MQSLLKEVKALRNRLDVLEDRVYPRGEGKEIEQVDILTGKVVARYESMALARRQTGIHNISAVAHGRLLSAGGFAWRFTGAKHKPLSPGAPPKYLADIDVLASLIAAQGNKTVFLFDIKANHLDSFNGKGTRLYHAVYHAKRLGKIDVSKQGRWVTLALKSQPTAAQAPEPPQEIPVERARVSPRSEPKTFIRLNRQGIMDQVLDLCATGIDNHAVSEKTGASPSQVNRARTRSKWISNYWDLIDNWHRRHPGADVRRFKHAK